MRSLSPIFVSSLLLLALFFLARRQYFPQFDARSAVPGLRAISMLSGKPGNECPERGA